MRKRCLAILSALCLLLAACGKKTDDAPHTRTVFAMDTVMNLTAYGSGGEAALAAAEAELYRLDALLARGNEDSAVYAYNRGAAAEDDGFRSLLSTAEEIRDATDGAFDPYLGGVLDLWGFGSGAPEHRVPTAEELDRIFM